MSKRLKVLEDSLAKKEEKLNELFSNHFESVKATNGQPLNDKRNGHKTFALWERQNNAIRRQQAELEKTKIAIEKEKDKIANVEIQQIPSYLKEYLENGTITQWRKYPNRFFVVGGGRARIVYKNNGLFYSHLDTCDEQEKETFIRVLREISSKSKKGLGVNHANN